MTPEQIAELALRAGRLARRVAELEAVTAGCPRCQDRLAETSAEGEPDDIPTV